MTPATPRAPKIVITGEPGSGKTTLVGQLVERLERQVSLTGFLTEEVRDGARRLGFRGRTFDGQSFPLASRTGEGDFRVGPYRVDLEGLETVGVPALVPGPDTRLVVLDEIGKMECFSEPFRRRVLELLDAEVAFVATVSATGPGLPKRVRHDPRVTLLRLRRGSAAGLREEVLRRLAAAGIAARTGSRERA